MKKLFCMLFSFLFLFSASCSAGNQGEPKICERLSFYERDGMLSALLSFAADESGKSETETFSRKTRGSFSTHFCRQRIRSFINRCAP